MLNRFGVFTRKLRSIHNESMREMADKLHISASYLSAAELNKRNIPIEWLDDINIIYQLSRKEYAEMKLAYDLTQMSNMYDKLNLPDTHKQILLSQYIELVKMSSL